MRVLIFFFPVLQNRSSAVLGLLFAAICAHTAIAQGVDISPAAARTRTQPESELVLEGLGSFGHFHIFAYSWWSYLEVSGIEYDRHSWDRFLGARRDYVAEILPVAILRQPSKTDVFGDPSTPTTK